MKIQEISEKSKEYPMELKKIKDFPKKIYVIGNIELLQRPMIAIVGTRRCTEYGKRQAFYFSKELSKRGICVVSGMAIGIDTAAHFGAIEEEGKTVAVLGSGFFHIYPKENQRLLEEILKKGGCALTEYPSNTQVDKANFPKRNRMISGLAKGVLVVEAMYRGGSSITANFAKKQNKPVFCVPSDLGKAQGVGSNALIQKGAKLVVRVDDIIKEIEKKEKFFWKGNLLEQEKEGNREIREKKESKEEKNKIENEKMVEEQHRNRLDNSFSIKEITETKVPQEYLPIYELIKEKLVHIEEIYEKTEIPIQKTNTILTMLELQGFIRKEMKNQYRRIK